FFQAEDGIRDLTVTGVQTCALPICRAWLVHCYGMVGAGRDNDVDSGGGTELYVVIGQAPRHLDRNVTLLGRVVSGMELLSVMPRSEERRVGKECRYRWSA